MTAGARPLRELASVIRSKNAKPYRLTLDVLFERRDVFEHVRDAGALSETAVAAAYGISEEQITSSFVFDAGMGFKFTLMRPRVQGSVGDSDIYGAQQHAPLLDIDIPWGAGAPSLDEQAG